MVPVRGPVVTHSPGPLGILESVVEREQRNGLVLFVFTEDHAARFEVGRGLEGALPDVLAGRILDGELIPKAKTGDWDGAIAAAVDAAIGATKGEFKGTGARGGGHGNLQAGLTGVLA